MPRQQSMPHLSVKVTKRLLELLHTLAGRQSVAALTEELLWESPQVIAAVERYGIIRDKRRKQGRPFKTGSDTTVQPLTNQPQQRKLFK